MHPELTFRALSLLLIVSLALSLVAVSLVSMRKENRFGWPLRGIIWFYLPIIVPAQSSSFSRDMRRKLGRWIKSPCGSRDVWIRMKSSFCCVELAVFSHQQRFAKYVVNDCARNSAWPNRITQVSVSAVAMERPCETVVAGSFSVAWAGNRSSRQGRHPRAAKCHRI